MGEEIVMIIEQIKLKNYRQYKEATINLGVVEKNKQVIIIEGTTGAGKTNLLNAITWCLYGKEFYLSKKDEGLPITNTLALGEVNINKIVLVEVEIFLASNDKTKKYKIKRTCWVKKLSDGGTEQIVDRYLSNQPDGSKLEVFATWGKDTGYFRDPNHAIQRLLPENVHEYFFFDGERLDDYFRKRASNDIKDAVFKVSQLELLERVISHIESMRNRFLKDSKELTPKVKELEEKRESFFESLKKENEELNKLSTAKKEAEKNRKEIQKELIGFSPEKVKRLAEERVELEKDLSHLEKEVGEEKKSKSEYLISIAPLIFAFDAISSTYEAISKREEAGEIPPDYKKNFLDKLLQKGICICGTDISKKEQPRKNIEKLLEECDEITNITEELISLHSELRSLQEEIFNFDKNREIYNKRIEKLNEEIKEKNARLKKVEEGIRGCDIERVKSLEEKYEEFNDKISEADAKTGEKKAIIDNINVRIKAVETDLEKELKKEEKLKEVGKINSFCNYVLDAAKKIKDEIMEGTRKEIEEITKKQFFAIIPKKVTYSDVKIDDNYNFSVVDQNGRKALGTLSAGERESLALSFMAALNIVSGFNAPIIIDTPLARIDTEPRENIATTIPKYFKGLQVTLLVTSAEYTPNVREALSKSICKEYKLQFKEYKGGSECEVAPYG